VGIRKTQRHSRQPPQPRSPAPDDASRDPLRFYGPEKPLFDKTWVLPEIEDVNVKATTQ
jgi:hypothetical protein